MDLEDFCDGSFPEDAFCTLILGAWEADSEGAIDGVRLYCERAGGDAAPDIIGSSSIVDSGRGGYADRLVFCVTLDGCCEIAERGDQGLSSDCPLPFAVRGGDIGRAADLGESSCITLCLLVGNLTARMRNRSHSITY